MYGYVDAGPMHPDDADPGSGERRQSPEPARSTSSTSTPRRKGMGGGRRLLEAAEAWLDSAGFTRAELSMLTTNPPAQAFYRAQGWLPTGRIIPVDLGVVAFDEMRFSRPLGRGEP